MGDPFLTVVYSGEPDVVFEFAAEGTGRLFGRDDTACHIVIWSALNGANLSRVAGRIWRMDGELWIRNLSCRHELGIRTPSMPPEQPLRRRRNERMRGEARSLPAPLCTVTGPDGCELYVRQVQQPRRELFDLGLPEATLPAVPEVPDALRTVAAALCEPLLNGHYLPASYREVMARIGEPSMKTVRRLVGDLCGYYAEASPQLHQRVVERMMREQRQLGIPEGPRLSRGVWTFGNPPAPAAGADAQENGRRALALPEYFEVARLLVSHFRITEADVDAFPAPAQAPAD